MGKRKQSCPQHLQLIGEPSTKCSSDVKESGGGEETSNNEEKLGCTGVKLKDFKMIFLGEEAVSDSGPSKRSRQDVQQMYNDMLPIPSNITSMYTYHTSSDEQSNNGGDEHSSDEDDDDQHIYNHNDMIQSNTTSMFTHDDASSSDDNSSYDDDDKEQSKERRAKKQKKKTMNLRGLASTKSFKEEMEEKLELVRQQMFKCEYPNCSKKYRKKWDLKQHQVKSHQSFIKCEICTHVRLEYFATEEEYRKHKILVHHNKPYACRICNARYASSNGLKKHLHELHLTEKPHQCKIVGCGMAFKTLGGLKYHVRDCAERLKRRKHICPQCAKSYSTRRYLLNHMKTHSNTLK